MKAAIVAEAGKPPVYGDFPDPTPVSGEVPISVQAAALSNLAKGRAAGTHYSASSPLPFVVGVDGVGRLEDGRRVYFALPRAPYGSMSEKTVIRPAQCTPVPDGLDDVTAAAIVNPGMSSWAALKERARMVPGENVLVNGATGTAGRLAVQIAKYRGAKRVVATGRNATSLNEVGALGADATIPIGNDLGAFENAVVEEFRGGGIDVVLDYLWGPSAERIIGGWAKAGKGAAPMRFVQVGSVSAPSITLPSADLRATGLTILGSGLGSVPMDRLAIVLREVLEATGPGGFKIATRVVPLSQVASVWTLPEAVPRIVFQIP